MFFCSAFLRNTEHNQHTVDTRKWVTGLCLTLHNTELHSLFTLLKHKGNSFLLPLSFISLVIFNTYKLTHGKLNMKTDKHKNTLLTFKMVASEVLLPMPNQSQVTLPLKQTSIFKLIQLTLSKN